MFDYSGSLDKYQKQLDAEGIDFDVTCLMGATEREIKDYVEFLINNKKTGA